jgi:hypothetical protein
MHELDEAAWERWVAYRKAIRKPIKEVSEHAMKLKLARFGADQDAVVSQSIANQYQGLFELKDKKKPDRPTKSPEQKAADDALFVQAQERSARAWDKLEPSPLNRLKLCDALWARYTFMEDSEDARDRMEWLRGVIAMHLREAEPTEVLADPHLRTMVFCLFGPRGISRLKEREVKP